MQALTFGGAMAVVTLLEHGDLLATCDDGTLLAVEANASDLLNSIRDDRLWAQLAGIKALTPWAYLLVTGELRRGEDGNVPAEGRASVVGRRCRARCCRPRSYVHVLQWRAMLSTSRLSCGWRPEATSPK